MHKNKLKSKNMHLEMPEIMGCRCGKYKIWIQMPEKV